MGDGPLPLYLRCLFLRASRLGARVRPGRRRTRGCAGFIVHGTLCRKRTHPMFCTPQSHPCTRHVPFMV